MAYLDSGPTEDPKAEKPKDEKDRTAQYVEAIDRYDRGTDEWRGRAEKITKIYLDQHRSETARRRFALLWANIETLKPAVYARLPVAVVSRRFKDADPIGRKAGEVLERCINTTFDLYGVNEVMECVRDDRLLTSRGTAWVRYEPDFEKVEGKGKDDKGEAILEDRLRSETICVEYVHWADFGHSLNRTWPEVTLVWRRVYMTRDKVEDRWGKDLAEKLVYQVRPEYAQRYGPEVKDATDPQAVIYEIWDKPNKVVSWLAKEEKLTLEGGDPPLNFRGFWPCPKPCYGTKTTGSLIPVPDYRYYQDQAEEIDDVTAKIADLTDQIKLKAFIPGGPSTEGTDAIKRMIALQQQAEGTSLFVEVESWAGFTEKGGTKGLVDWWPIDMVVEALKGAIEVRQQLKADAFEITGISDILRGETDPNETLGAQELKAQTGSRRIATTQRDIARFARDLAELVGEIISEVFQPQTMQDMSGFDLTTEAPPEMMAQAKQLTMQMQQGQQQQPMMPGQPPQPPAQPDPKVAKQLEQIQKQLQEIQTNKQVIALLRDERTRGYRVEIETDSTIEPDEQAEKQRRMEFLEAVGQFLQQSLPMLQAMPASGQMMGEMLMFMVRGFRAGRQLEDIIEQSTQKLAEMAQQPPPPNPEQIKAEVEKQKIQAQQQADAAELQAKTQADAAKAQLDERVAQIEAEFKARELALKERELELKQQLEAQKLELEKQRSEREHQQAAEQFSQKLASDETIHRTKLEADDKKTQATLAAQHAEGEASRGLEEKKAGVPAATKAQQQVQELSSSLSDLMIQVKAITEHMSEPVELVYKDGRLSGARRGKQTISVKRAMN